MSILQQSYCKTTVIELMCRCLSDRVDVEEIKRHNRFAHRWWDEKNGPMRGLHAMNELRIQFIRVGLIDANKIRKDAANEPKFLKGIRILDVGCGGGILTIPLARLGANITGLDPSEELINVAKDYASKHLKQETNIEFLSTTIEEHSIINQESYDAVILSEVLEHISSKELFLNSCLNVLKPCGSLFITTINQTYLGWLAAIVLAENVMKLLPRGTHEWQKLVPLNELKIYLRKSGCKILKTKGMLYIPYKNVWHWVPLTSINYAVHAVKLN